MRCTCFNTISPLSGSVSADVPSASGGKRHRQNHLGRRENTGVGTFPSPAPYHSFVTPPASKARIGMPANDKQRRGAIRAALILLAIVIALFVTVIVKRMNLVQANSVIMRKLLIFTVVMFGFGFALKNCLHCQSCRYLITPGRQQYVQLTAGQYRSLENVELDANTRGLPWQFKPLQSTIRVHPGNRIR